MSINTDYRVQDGINVDKNLEKNAKAHKIKEIGLSCLKGFGALGLAGISLGCLGMSVTFSLTALAVAMQTPYWPVALVFAVAAVIAVVLSAIIFAAATDAYDSAKESAKNAGRFDQVVEARKEEINKL
jgi:hypothetical protein